MAGDGLVIHEWGTFTALQDDSGAAVNGINVDDEPVPRFVHNLASHVLVRPHAAAEHKRWEMMQGAPRAHPSVTMRLETPVIYFHPPRSQTKPFDVRVDVALRGGWLTEYYPAAQADAPGLDAGRFQFDDITSRTIGRLSWPRVTVGTGGTGPATDEHVWTAPRAVAAATISVPGKNGAEQEKYLFYRGVGRIEVPLRVVTERKRGSLDLYANTTAFVDQQSSWAVPALWLVETRGDGTLAYYSHGPLNLARSESKPTVTIDYQFRDNAFSAANPAKLRAEMHATLVAQGLLADEATAMLATWQKSYFQSAGLRLFFVVPRTWTDAVLPLSITPQPARIERVMVGRIELVTSQQRQLLQQLAAAENCDSAWLRDIVASAAAEKFFAGRSDFGDLGVPIPADYQAYLDLGRFRNALVLAEERARPTPALARFIKVYGLSAYRPPGGEPRQVSAKPHAR